jgi:hypothetical protein
MALEDVVKEGEELALEAYRKLAQEFREGKPSEMTRAYLQSIAIYKGLTQANNNRYGLCYRVAKDLAMNQAELRDIIRVSLPIVNPAKVVGDSNQEKKTK